VEEQERRRMKGEESRDGKGDEMEQED